MQIKSSKFVQTTKLSLLGRIIELVKFEKSNFWIKEMGIPSNKDA